MDTDKAIDLEGVIMAVLPGTMFRVALQNQHLVLAHISGKMRKRFIRLTAGDRVRLKCRLTTLPRRGSFTGWARVSRSWCHNAHQKSPAAQQ